MTFRDQLADKTVLPGIPELGERGTVRHMCPDPDCVRPVAGTQQPNPFCPVCLGAGSVTTERLEMWQRLEYQKARKGNAG